MNRQKRITYICILIIATVSIFLPTYILFRNLGVMAITFFIFGSMFAMGYFLLKLSFKRLREEGVNV